MYYRWRREPILVVHMGGGTKIEKEHAHVPVRCSRSPHCSTPFNI